MTDLNIPLEAIQLAEAAVLVLDVVDEPDVCDVATDAITAAAPLVVAAELEQRVAELIQVQQRLRADDDPGVRKYGAYGVEEAISSVRARIAALRGEQS